MGYESIITAAQNNTLQVTPYYARKKTPEEQKFDETVREHKDTEDKYTQTENQYNERLSSYDEELKNLDHLITNSFGGKFTKARTERFEFLTKERENTENLLKAEQEKHRKFTESYDPEESDNSPWNGKDTEFAKQNEGAFNALSEKLNGLLAGNESLQGCCVEPENPVNLFLQSKNAQRTLEQAAKHHFDLNAKKNVPDYLSIFMEDPSYDFEESVTGNATERPDRPYTDQDVEAKKNQQALTGIFSSNDPMRHPGFLNAVYTRLRLILDPDAVSKMNAKEYDDRVEFANPYANRFFTDRGDPYAPADDDALMSHANQLVNLYELAKNADRFIAELPKVSDTANEDERKKQEFQREEIIERLNMLKSQKGFLSDELKRLEALANPYSPFFDLNSPDTLKMLSELYEKAEKEQRIEAEQQKDPDFFELCRSCHERWVDRTITELEAAESLMTECRIREGNDPYVKLDEIRMIVWEPGAEDGEGQIVPYTREDAKKALLANKEVKMFFDRPDPDGDEPERVSLDLKNDGKRAWATYKVQIDCDCQSLDPKTLPKKPGKALMFWNFILKKISFGTAAVAEVEEYYAAEAKLKEATENVKAYMAKKAQAEAAGKENDGNSSDPDSEASEIEVQNLLKKEEEERKEWDRLVAEEKKYHDLFSKLQDTEFGKNDAIWKGMSEQEQAKHLADALAYRKMKEIWDNSSESAKQKSRITDLRSSKMLERRAVKKAEEKITKRNAVKSQVRAKVTEFTAELFKERQTFKDAGFSNDVQDILLGKSVSGIDLTRLGTNDLQTCIHELTQDLDYFGGADADWKNRDFSTWGSKIIQNSTFTKNAPAPGSRDPYLEAKRYYEGKSEIEVFDGLCKESRADNLKDNSHIENKADRQTPEEIEEARKKDGKIAERAVKRQSSLQKAILLHAKQRLQELHELLPVAKKNDAEAVLRSNEVSVKNIESAILSVVIAKSQVMFTRCNKSSENEYKQLASDMGEYFGPDYSGVTGGVKNHLDADKAYDRLKDLVSRHFGMSSEDLKKELMQVIQKNARIETKAVKSAFENYPEFKTKYAELHNDLFVDPIANLQKKLAAEKAANNQNQRGV